MQNNFSEFSVISSKFILQSCFLVHFILLLFCDADFHFLYQKVCL